LELPSALEHHFDPTLGIDWRMSFAGDIDSSLSESNPEPKTAMASTILASIASPCSGLYAGARPAVRFFAKSWSRFF